jgi:hypothetical protein
VVHRRDEMVQSAFDEIGWNPADFDVCRLRIEYPVLHSVARMQFPAEVVPNAIPR